jgi:AraC family transcriptional regulator
VPRPSQPSTDFRMSKLASGRLAEPADPAGMSAAGMSAAAVSDPLPLRQRLGHVAGGRFQEDPGVVLFSSAQLPWRGFPWERHAVSSGHERRVFWPTPRLGLVEVGAFRMHEQTGGGTRRFLAGVDSITIWPAGHESSNLTWQGTGEIIDVGIDFALVERLQLLDQDPTAVRLTVQPGIQDRDLAALVRAMEAEVRSGCLSGRLYGESLSMAVAAHIVARYSTTRQPLSRPRGALTRRRLSAVFDFVRANLGSDLGIGELAGVARLSPSGFTHLFRRATGVTPHQFVMRERIAEAQRLLRAGNASVAEVALALGFATQSHFGQVFRRLVGTTPKRYQETQGAPD